MQVREFELDVAVDSSSARSLSWLEKRVMAQIGASSVPIRFVVNAMGAASWRCDVAVVEGVAPGFAARSRSLFEFRKREAENTGAFNVALVIPTGIACTIGGHAGDANPVVKLMASVCDTLITHPNAVNASDLNELPANALYVEGSTLSRLLMGTAGLRPTRANRVLAAVEAHEEAPVLNAAINSVAAAVATYGLSSAGIVLIDPALQLASHATPAGRVGRSGISTACSMWCGQNAANSTRLPFRHAFRWTPLAVRPTTAATANWSIPGAGWRPC